MKGFLIALLTIIGLTATATAQTAEELKMVNLINEVRTNPKSFIPAVEFYIEILESKSKPFVEIKGATVTKKTNHTSDAVKPMIDEAKKLIVFLNTVKPVDKLEISNELYPVTKIFASYLDSTKQLGHTGYNGQSLNARTKKFRFMLVGENCVKDANVETAMLQLLLDFGTKSKGHRTNIFDKSFTKVAVAKIGYTWVQDFAN